MEHVTDWTTVYRLFAGDGELLYVGISRTWRNRLADHEAEKAWWPMVERVELVHVETRGMAETIEQVAIQRLKPRFNLAMNGGAYRGPIEQAKVLRRDAEIEWPEGNSWFTVTYEGGHKRPADVRMACFVCGSVNVYSRGRCSACFKHWQRYGEERPERLIERHRKRRAA